LLGELNVLDRSYPGIKAEAEKLVNDEIAKGKPNTASAASKVNVLDAEKKQALFGIPMTTAIPVSSKGEPPVQKKRVLLPPNSSMNAAPSDLDMPPMDKKKDSVLEFVQSNIDLKSLRSMDEAGVSRALQTICTSCFATFGKAESVDALYTSVSQVLGVSNSSNLEAIAKEFWGNQKA